VTSPEVFATAILMGAYVVMSSVTFWVYGRDKSAARYGRHRTPEFTLHVLALCFGWPGALAGQRVYRHKTRKQPFRAVFWCTVIANVVAAAWLFQRFVAMPR
jgi:uncharacterized membrane protein YsdA (DUF1294 family)